MYICNVFFRVSKYLTRMVCNPYRHLIKSSYIDWRGGNELRTFERDEIESDEARIFAKIPLVDPGEGRDVGVCQDAFILEVVVHYVSV
jgi:hypothetical protein